MASALAGVASHRNAVIRPLADVLDGYANLGQGRWLLWRRRSNSDHLPAQFTPVLDAVIAFADPVLTSQVQGLTWNPDVPAWE